MPNSDQIAVEVHQPTEMTDAAVKRVYDALGLAADGETLEEFAEHVASLGTLPPALWITVGGKPHTAASAFLEQQQNTEWQTQHQMARHLRILIDFSVNEKGYSADRCDLAAPSGDVFDLTDDEYRELKDELHGEWLPQTWNAFNSTVKRFFLFTLLNYDTPGPFKLEERRTRFGRSVTNGHERRGKRQSIGLALEPDWVREILQAWKSHGSSSDGPLFHARDLAFMSLAFGTGMRRSSLLGTVTYEIPDMQFDVNGERLPLVWFEVPWATAKYSAGADAQMFSQHLPAIHAWIREKTDIPNATPKNPISLAYADIDRWEGKDAAGNRIGDRWVNTRMNVRSRMVNPDGSSPLLFLNQHGRPLSERFASKILPTAAALARNKLRKLPDIRLHDARHTYASHLGYLLTLDGQQQATEVVRRSLGHMSEATTNIYTQALSRWLVNGSISADAVKWRSS